MDAINLILPPRLSGEGVQGRGQILQSDLSVSEGGTVIVPPVVAPPLSSDPEPWYAKTIANFKFRPDPDGFFVPSYNCVTRFPFLQQSGHQESKQQNIKRVDFETIAIVVAGGNG